MIISHWNYTTEPVLAPWELNVANLEPYPHHFHGSRVFHFEETFDINVQPLITEIYSYDWDESDYWGGVNKYTATQVVTHIADGNTTALDSLLADDFSKFMCVCISSDRYGVCGRFISVSRTLFFLKKKGRVIKFACLPNLVLPCKQLSSAITSFAR